MQYLKSLLWIWAFLLLTSYFYYGDFQQFQEQKYQKQYTQETLKDQIGKFSVDHIRPIGHITLEGTPNTQVIDTIVQKIRASKKQVYINTYIFTEKKIRAALIEAKKRGVDVKVIVEKNVYKAPNLNKATFDLLTEAWIAIHYSPSKNFSLNHAKYIVFDESVLVSTGNYSYANFKDKRDFFMFISDDRIFKDLESLFLWDFAGDKTFFYEENTLLWSYDARLKLETLLQSAQKSIDMYVPYIQDDALFTLLIWKLKAWVTVRIVTWKSNMDDENLLLLKQKWAVIAFFPKEVHAKAMEVDKKVLYVGSLNFSAPSIDQNREVGVIISNPDTLKKFDEYFLEGL